MLFLYPKILNDIKTHNIIGSAAHNNSKDTNNATEKKNKRFFKIKIIIRKYDPYEDVVTSKK